MQPVPVAANVGTTAQMTVVESTHAIEALALSELKYRNLFLHMPMALWQVDISELTPLLARLRLEGVTDLGAYLDAHPEVFAHILQIMRIEMVNAHAVSLFGGVTAEDFIGPVARFWQDSLPTMRRALVARYRGAGGYEEETRIRALDGRLVDVFCAATFAPELAEMGICIVGSVDIGRRLEAERALQRVNADFAHAARLTTLGELTASIAHEVNQPLAAITTNGEACLRWLLHPQPDVEELRNLAMRMTLDARRAADIIGRIRSMATRRSFELRPLAINALVQEGLKLLDHEMEGLGVALELELAPGLPCALGDATQLQQVFVNLAMNAVQAMAEAESSDPRLIVRTRHEGARIAVDVEDRGPGLEPDAAGRLFESFFTTKAGGLGIGLAICKSIIDAHEGTIGVSNLAVGTRFTFTLAAER